MSIKNFNIESLLDFTPPKYSCYKCYALFSGPLPIKPTGKQIICPVCKLEYIRTDEYPSYAHISTFLRDMGHEIKFRDLIEHSRELARIASDMRRGLPGASSPQLIYPPMRALFSALQAAENFVHFTTYGISHMLLGAIKMTGTRVSVKGVVSGVENNILDELNQYEEESPRLRIRIFERNKQIKGWDTTPHQKIIVIDGLIAFKGSANLTLSGWRKAAQGRDVIDLVTDVKEVVELHNRFFSPIWAEFDDSQQIEMDSIPF